MENRLKKDTLQVILEQCLFNVKYFISEYEFLALLMWKQM